MTEEKSVGKQISFLKALISAAIQPNKFIKEYVDLKRPIFILVLILLNVIIVTSRLGFSFTNAIKGGNYIGLIVLLLIIVMTFYVFITIIYIGGRVFGGKGSYRDVVACYFWSTSPQILLFPFHAVILLNGLQKIGYIDFGVATSLIMIVSLVSGFIILFAFVLQFVNFIRMMIIVQELTTGRVVGSILVSSSIVAFCGLFVMFALFFTTQS